MKNVLSSARKLIYSSLGMWNWKVLEYFDPSWSKRISEMARFIVPGNSVMDLGCGKMWLRQYIGNSPYFPIDYTFRGEGTIICDFNKKEFPDIKADTAFVSGTLEYVRDPNWFINMIAEHCKQCIISYCTVDNFPILRFRKRQAWVNHFTRDELIRLFSEKGFMLSDESTEIPKNHIFSFVK